VVAKFRERLAASKQTTHRVHMEWFNLKKLNDVEGKEHYHVQISNRFADLENLDADVDNNRASRNISANTNILVKQIIGYYELKKQKSCFDDRCSEVSDQSKQTKLQRLQDPSEINGDNLNNIRRETSRHFRN
jgi:hypothetical protein